jgi:hypothetical protein
VPGEETTTTTVAGAVPETTLATTPTS